MNKSSKEALLAMAGNWKNDLHLDEMLAQIYLKRGCLVPNHSHESEQITYVLQGALKFLIGGDEITVREGEVLHIPSWVEHQAEALEDTFELDIFSPIRQDWLDHTDDYFHRK
jgi:quercetin dioxygenase-like cupin family protein